MRSMRGRNCTIMGTEGTTGAIVADADEDELLEDGRAPPPPLVKVPTETTEADRADDRSDPQLWDNGAVDDASRFSSHSAI